MAGVEQIVVDKLKVGTGGDREKMFAVKVADGVDPLLALKAVDAPEPEFVAQPRSKLGDVAVALWSVLATVGPGRIAVRWHTGYRLLRLAAFCFNPASSSSSISMRTGAT